MENDFMKRGYLLPEGCKDLIDALKLRQRPGPCWLPTLKGIPDVLAKKDSTQFIANPKPLPPVQGELRIPVGTTVAQLAALLHEKPFRVIAELMQLGVFVTASQVLDFGTITRLARRYGFIAEPAG